MKATPDSYASLQSQNGTVFSISESGIAWPVDLSYTKNWDLTKQKFSIENEHWLVWLRPAVRKDFYKLWGIVGQKMPAGVYSIVITNSTVWVIQTTQFRLDRSGCTSPAPTPSAATTRC